MKAKEFIPTSKPRNFVAKNQQTAGAGAHKDKKRADKQGNVKHKGKEYAEGVAEGDDPYAGYSDNDMYFVNLEKTQREKEYKKVQARLQKIGGFVRKYPDLAVQMDIARSVYGWLKKGQDFQQATVLGVRDYNKSQGVSEDKAGWSIKGSPKPAPKGPAPSWKLNPDGTATDKNTGITYNRDGSVKSKEGVAEGSFGSGFNGPFTAVVTTGERPKSRTKTKKFRREDDAILWSEDWLEDFPQYVYASIEVKDSNDNVVWQSDDEQGVAEYGTHPSQRVDPRTGKRLVPPKSPLTPGVAEGASISELTTKKTYNGYTVFYRGELIGTVSVKKKPYPGGRTHTVITATDTNGNHVVVQSNERGVNTVDSAKQSLLGNFLKQGVAEVSNTTLRSYSKKAEKELATPGAPVKQNRVDGVVRAANKRYAKDSEEVYGKVKESLRRGEYYVHTVHFADGGTGQIKTHNDEQTDDSIKAFYVKQGKDVVKVDYNWGIKGEQDY